MRAKPHQQGPRQNLDFDGFPEATLPANEPKYRAHSAGHGGAAGAWYFSTGPSGRFNLDGDAGTCYLADTPKTAVQELFGPELQDMQGVGLDLASRFLVTPVHLPVDMRAADLDHEDAHAFGVTNELSASAYETYEVPRQWAAALEAAGYQGIRYISRMVAGSAHASWAIFGPAGPQPAYPYDATRSAPALDVLRDLGITIFGEDRSTDLTVQTPPWS